MDLSQIMALDIFLFIGVLAFALQLGVIGYSIRMIRLMGGYTVWRNAWLVWIAMQALITVRRLLALYFLVTSCDVPMVGGSYRGWLIDGMFLLILSVGYLIFMRMKFNIFSDSIKQIKGMSKSGRK